MTVVARYSCHILWRYISWL